MSSGDSTAHETTGEFPQCWTPTTMGEIGRYLNGFAFNSKTWARSGRPIIRIQNLTGSGSEFNYFEGDIEERYIVRDGDLLFSWAATLGVFVWRGPEAVLNQHIFKVESRINSSFHRYLIEHKIAEMMQQTHGTGMVHITKKKFDAVPVYEPPLDEQEKIVEILEERFSRLDAALTAVQKAREKSTLFRRSLLHSTMVRPSESTSESNSDEWQSTSLGTVVNFLNGYGFKSEWYTEEGMRLVRGQNISHGYLDWSDTRRVSHNKATEFSRFNLKEGDILVSLDRPIISTGFKWAVVKQSDLPALLLQRVAVLRPDEEVLDAGYLRLWVQSPHLVEKINPGRSNGIPHISTNELAALEISFPSLKNQHQVVREVEEQLENVKRSEDATGVICNRAQNLRRSLLHAAFSGNLTKEWREDAHV